MTEVVFLFAEITTSDGHEGIGFSYSKRAGGPGLYAHAVEIAPVLLGEDPNDIGRLWTKLVWAGASVGRSGLATQAVAAFDIALWDLKARRAGLPLAKLLGAHRDSVRCYNTSGGFLHTPTAQVLENATATLAAGIGGIKIKVGDPERGADLRRVAAVREHVGDGVPLMVDANQQWDRPTAQRMGRALEEFDLTWIEEPLDAYDAEGHAALAASLDTPVASGEMLASVAEHWELIRHRSVDVIQPDAPRVGGITQFLKLAALADHHQLQLAPHFAMEIQLRLAGAAVHRAAAHRGRPDARARPARPRYHAHRTGAALDQGVPRRERPVAQECGSTKSSGGGTARTVLVRKNWVSLTSPPHYRERTEIDRLGEYRSSGRRRWRHGKSPHATLLASECASGGEEQDRWNSRIADRARPVPDRARYRVLEERPVRRAKKRGGHVSSRIWEDAEWDSDFSGRSSSSSTGARSTSAARGSGSSCRCWA